MSSNIGIVLCEGKMEKFSRESRRSRFTSFFSSNNWKTRHFKLEQRGVAFDFSYWDPNPGNENGIYYWDKFLGRVQFGGSNTGTASAAIFSPESNPDIDPEKKFIFTVTLSKTNEVLYLAASSEDDRTKWINSFNTMCTEELSLSRKEEYRNKLTDEERRWVLDVHTAIHAKGTSVSGAAMGKTLSPMLLMQLAIATKGKVPTSIRHLRNMAASEKRYTISSVSDEEVLEWMEENHPTFVHPCSRDVYGRSCIGISCGDFIPSNLSTPKDWTYYMKMMHLLMDVGCTCLEDIRAGTIQVVQAKDLGWKNFSVQFEIRLAELMQENYPFKMKCLVMVDPPTIIYAMVNMVKAVLTKKLSDRIVVTEQDKLVYGWDQYVDNMDAKKRVMQSIVLTADEAQRISEDANPDHIDEEAKKYVEMAGASGFFGSFEDFPPVLGGDLEQKDVFEWLRQKLEERKRSAEECKLYLEENPIF